jgi:hypothetical protein
MTLIPQNLFQRITSNTKSSFNLIIYYKNPEYIIMKSIDEIYRRNRMIRKNKSYLFNPLYTGTDRDI